LLHHNQATAMSDGRKRVDPCVEINYTPDVDGNKEENKYNIRIMTR